MNHINIHHPDERRRYMRDAIAIAELDARVKVLENYLRETQSDLESIFNRVWNNEPVELNYKDGTVIVVKGDNTP